MVEFNKLGRNVTIAAIIPVFKDDRIEVAVKALIEQKVGFDKIIIQDPLGDYSYLEKLSDNVIVNDDDDNGLFDGIDKCIDKYDFDYYFLQGADDLLLSDRFVERFKSLSFNPDIYFERIQIIGRRGVRFWPFGALVRKGYVLPPHFGSVYKRQLLLNHRMKNFALDGNVGADSAWFYTLNIPDLQFAYTDDLSFSMAAGGISNNGIASPIKNLISMERKIRKYGGNSSKAVVKYFIATFVKLCFLRKVR